MAECRSRYERLPKHPGIWRQHSTSCAWVQHKRCNCTPTYRAEAFDKVTKKRKYESRPTLESAARWRTDTQVAIRDGRYRVTEVITIGDAWKLFQAGINDGSILAKGGTPYKPSTIRNYESKFESLLIERFGKIPLTELRLVHVQDLIDELHREGAMPQTIKNTVMPLRALYRWCIRRELAIVNPCDHAEYPSGEVARDHIVSPFQALLLLAALPVEDQAVWATAFFAGLRRGELMALDWPNAHLAERVLRVERAYDPGSRTFGAPKSKKGTRDVGLPKLLIPYLAALPRHRGLVFGRTEKQPFNEAMLHKRAKAAWEAAGLQRITLQECRHTYASLMIDAGVNFKTLSEWMGHASITITIDRYGHLLPGGRDTVLDQIDTYLEKALELPDAA